MQSLLRKLLAPALATFFVASFAQAASLTGNVTVVLDPPAPLGVGDDTTFLIDGKPGDLPFLVYSRNPGPITLPIVGQLELGTPFFILNLPQFPASGHLEVPCPLNCDFVNIAPIYSQVVAITLGVPITLSGKSDQIVLSVDSSLIEDCNGNLIDDDCELETGAPDCDGDGLIDSCEDDCDGNMVPDECEPFEDCNGNLIPDQCEDTNDCDMDGVPDDCEPDCDMDGTPDDCESDCDANGTPDDCEPMVDCNGNMVPDRCDISSGNSNDADGNGVPDECEDCDMDGTPDSLESDCDANGTPDDCEPMLDCNGNMVPDRCDISSGNSNDADGNGVPDECEDCDMDGTPDSLESDCDANGTPDDCEPMVDCNMNMVPDRCDISSGSSNDADGNGVPDECEDCDMDGTPDSLESDCDANGTPDDCEPMVDCNMNMVPDRCDISSGNSNDADGNGVPDECEDCDMDGTPDSLESDCDANGTPDDCEPMLDCNGNMVPDRCDLASGSSSDANGNGVPDECDPDCDMDGTPDDLEPDCDGNGTPDDCESDCNGNGVPDNCEGCFDTLSLVWDANDCAGPYDSFAEFTAVQDGGCFNVSAAASTLFSTDGHSCTDDALTGTAGGAFCINDQSEPFFDLTDSDALMVSVTLSESSGVPAQLEQFSFYQKAPEQYFTSQQDGSVGSLHDNRPPAQYGLRVSRDGVNIFVSADNATSADWAQEVFDFSGNSDFTVFNGTAVFEFYLLAWDPQGTGEDAVWDLDQFQVDVCCGEGGTAPDCDNDGTPDFCEPDCDMDGTPDDCEPDCDMDGLPDDCEPDCDMDGTPDDCEPDSNGNGVPDDCDIPCGDCDGKVNALTLLYTGSTTLDLTVRDRDDLLVYSGTVSPNEMFSFLPAPGASTFGTRIRLYDAGVQIQEIHTSCSQVILIGSVFGNFEVLNGSSLNGGPFCDGGSGGGCADCDGKVNALTLNYTGAATLDLEIQDRDGLTVFMGTVTQNQVISFLPVPGAADFGTTIELFDAGVSILEIHTSCSQPIGIGSVFGDFTVLDGSSVNGGPFCDLTQVVCNGNGKPEVLTCRYTGGNCASSSNSQPSDKWGCSGDPQAEGMVHVIAYKDGSTVYFDGFVLLNDTFDITAATGGDSELSSNTNVDIFDTNGTLLQQVNFHTSCSQPLLLGDRFGSVEIVGFVNN